MAPIAPNFTDCWFLDYATTHDEHTLLVRAEPSATSAVVSAAIDDFLTSFDSLLTSITVIGFRHRLAGGVVTLPESYGGSPTYGSGAQSLINRPAFIDFGGRGASGRRVHWTMFGLAGVSDDTYRITTAESLVVEATVTTLRGFAGSGVFKTIDYDDPFIYNYANVGFNAYWQRQARK